MVWSPKDLKMSMYFTKRLHGVVNVDVRMGICEVKDVMGKKEGWKCFDQGDGRNEGGTCKGYSCEKRKRPQHPVVVKSTDEEYGGLEGDGGSGGKNGQVQSGGTKTTHARCKERRTQRLTTFDPANHTLFMAHAGGYAIWWGWMS